MIIQRLFSEKKKSDKQESIDKVNLGLELGTAGSLGVGTSALQGMTKKSRLKTRKSAREGYLEGVSETLDKNMMKHSPEFSKNPELREGMMEFYKKEKQEFPKRATKKAKEIEKEIFKKNKKTAKMALGVSAGLGTARIAKGIHNKKKDSKEKES